MSLSLAVDQEDILRQYAVNATGGEAVTGDYSLIPRAIYTLEPVDISFPHPTVSESLLEAWQDSHGIGLNTPPRVMLK